MLRKPAILTLLSLVCLASNACAHGAKRPMPPWNPYFMFGDFDRGGLTRTGQKPDFISCSAPADKLRFDDQICMRGQDLKRLLLILDMCEQWPDPRPGD